MSTQHIHFFKTDYPVKNWDIAAQAVGQGYIPYSTEKNQGASGRHVMDDFGNLIQSLPQDLFDYREYVDECRVEYWGHLTGKDPAYYTH